MRERFGRGERLELGRHEWTTGIIMFLRGTETATFKDILGSGKQFRETAKSKTGIRTCYHERLCLGYTRPGIS